MTFSANTPTYLIGQNVDSVFDLGLAGIDRGGTPNGVLGSTISGYPSQLMDQAIVLGFTDIVTTPG